jgi:predicted ATPase
MLLLGTARDSEPCPDGLTALSAELAGDRRLVRIQIEGLSEVEVGELASAWLTKGRPAGLDAELHARTGGNPLFVEELLRHAEDSGRLGEAGMSAGVPAEVREVIGQRVDRLGERNAEALAFAAVVGPEFDLRVLAEGMGAQADDLIESLDAAVGARLLQECAGAPGRYHFSHDLVRETVYGNLSAARRSRLHLRVADAIEVIHGDGPKPLPDLARHLAAAGSDGDPQRAVHFLLLAAEQAGRGLATAEAIDLYNRALELIPEDDQSLRGEVKLRQALAYAAFTHVADARKVHRDSVAPSGG